MRGFLWGAYREYMGLYRQYLYIYIHIFYMEEIGIMEKKMKATV